MLDKNPKQVLDRDIAQIKNELSKNSINYIFCSKPFLKTEFLNRLVNSNSFQVFFLDFDLLYSGFVISGMLKKNKNVRIFRSSRVNLEKDLLEIIKKISKENVLVILDSLNGVYNMFDELESSRFINAIIMLLSSIAKHSKSVIVVTAVVKKNDNEEWILSPSGRRFIDSKKSRKYYLSTSETNLILKSIDE